MIKVLVVEDSGVARDLLVHILSADPGIRIVGTVNNGEEAIDALARLKPDVITMDIHMPKMDGFEATRRIMETQPVPIIIVSANWKPEEVALTFQAVEAGAVGTVEKPRGVGHPDHERMAKELVQTVKLMSEVRVVRRWGAARMKAATATPAPVVELKRPTGQVEIVAIGASTGGPPVLQTILAGLPKEFPVPVVIVQHIASGFVQGMADWLQQSTGFPTSIAGHLQQLEPGHAYLAPDEFHMGIQRGGRVVLSKTEPESSLRPAVSYLFRTIASAFGSNAVGVLLTGMGKDGAAELKVMKDNGAVTIAQDKESSIVHGMPGEAIALGAATYVLSPDKVPPMLTRLVSRT